MAPSMFSVFAALAAAGVVCGGELGAAAASADACQGACAAVLLDTPDGQAHGANLVQLRSQARGGGPGRAGRIATEQNETTALSHAAALAAVRVNASASVAAAEPSRGLAHNASAGAIAQDQEAPAQADEMSLFQNSVALEAQPRKHLQDNASADTAEDSLVQDVAASQKEQVQMHTQGATASPASGFMATILGLTVLTMLGVGLMVFSKAIVSVDLACIIAEFVGTFVLVFVVGCCVMVGDATWNATAIGSVLMVMVYATGPISGGNLNPAVTFALGLTGDLDWTKVIMYWVAQLSAGLAASASACLLLAPMGVELAPSVHWSGGYAMVVEMIYTCMLCFVVLNCAASKRNNNPDDGNQFYGLAIGFVIVAGGYAGGGISGGAFNPAVALGMDIKRVGLGWGIWYSLFEMLGAAIAALLYRAVRPDEAGASSLVDSNEATLTTKCTSEFLGTFILVLTVGLNIITGSTATAFSAAAALMCMIYSLGNVSGAHFNPAVTLACVVRGPRNTKALKEGIAFVFTQLLAGMCAAVVISAFHASSVDAATITLGVQPGSKYTIYAGGFAELVFTFILAYVVLATATTRPPGSQVTKQNFYFGLCIGSCVTVGGVAIGAVSGGELNPAVAAGLAMAGHMSPGSAPVPSYSYLVCFVAAELAAGILAAVVFRFTHQREHNAAFPPDKGALVCEFVGTAVLVFTVGCCIKAGDPVWNPTAIASVLMVMIYSTGYVSGGNLNPAVSMSLALTGDMEWSTTFKYWVAQLAGGLVAGCGYWALFGEPASLAPVAPYNLAHALVVEVIYTAMLCFVVLNCAASPRNNPKDDGNQFFGLAIGFVIIAGGYAAGGISGACFNPAVALGVDIKHLGFGHGILWALAELSGSVVAAALYFIVRGEEFSSGHSLTRSSSDSEPSLRVRCVAEFLGVFMLVLTVGLNIINSSPATAWSAAAALMCMIYALGNVSGGHFNPAVTLAVVVSGRDKCKAAAGWIYFAVQLMAGVLAGLLCAFFHAAGPTRDVRFALEPGAGHTQTSAGAAEFACTAILCYVVLAVATTRPPPSQKTANSFPFALCIGSCVTVGGFSLGAVSGGELNPAVALGIAMEDMFLGSFLNFAVWELAGGLLAACVFRLTHAGEFVSSQK